jgi:hypothetical protein
VRGKEESFGKNSKNILLIYILFSHISFMMTSDKYKEAMPWIPLKIMTSLR